ncbi:MAG: hypothetical protein AAFZ09_20700 [Pseudomonadota bacterium]
MIEILTAMIALICMFGAALLIVVMDKPTAGSSTAGINPLELFGHHGAPPGHNGMSGVIIVMVGAAVVTAGYYAFTSRRRRRQDFRALRYRR